MKKLLARGCDKTAQPLCFALLVLCLAQGVYAQGNQTINSLPAQDASFFSDLVNFLTNEAPDRYGEQFNQFVVSGGIHGTINSMTSTPFATVAYTSGGNRVNQASTGINYGSVGCATTDTAWVVASASSASTLSNFTQVPGTRYYVDCTNATQPALPSDSAWLMQVTIAGSIITAVTSLSNPSPVQSIINTYLQDSIGIVNARDYALARTQTAATINAAITALGSTVTGLLLDPGTWTIDANVVVPSNITLVFAYGAQLSYSGGATLSMVTLPVAGNDQIFANAGTSWTRPPPGEVRTEWFGNPCDGTDGAAEIQLTVDAMPYSGGHIGICSKTRMDSGVTIQHSGLKITCDNMMGKGFKSETYNGGHIFIGASLGGNLFTWSDTPDVTGSGSRGNSIENCSFQSDRSLYTLGGSVLYFDETFDFYAAYLDFKEIKGSGIEINQCIKCRGHDIIFQEVGDTGRPPFWGNGTGACGGDCYMQGNQWSRISAEGNMATAGDGYITIEADNNSNTFSQLNFESNTTTAGNDGADTGAPYIVDRGDFNKWSHIEARHNEGVTPGYSKIVIAGARTQMKQIDVRGTIPAEGSQIYIESTAQRTVIDGFMMGGTSPADATLKAITIDGGYAQISNGKLWNAGTIHVTSTSAGNNSISHINHDNNASRGVWLEAANNTVTDYISNSSDYAGPVIQVDANTNKITGGEIHGSSTVTAGILIQADYVTVDNVDIYSLGAAHGIYCNGEFEFGKINNNWIFNVGLNGIYIYDCTPGGINNNIIGQVSSSAAGTYAGIYFGGSSGRGSPVSVQGNTIRDFTSTHLASIYVEENGTGVPLYTSLIIRGNHTTDSADPFIPPNGQNRVDFDTTGQSSVVATDGMTLPFSANSIIVTGNGITVNTITARPRGSRVLLRVSGTTTFADGTGNLVLNGNCAGNGTGDHDMLELVSDGVNWRQVGACNVW